MNRIRRSRSTETLNRSRRIGRKCHEISNCCPGRTAQPQYFCPPGAGPVGAIEKILEYRPLQQLPFDKQQQQEQQVGHWLPVGWSGIEIRRVAPSFDGPVEYRQVLGPEVAFIHDAYLGLASSASVCSLMAPPVGWQERAAAPPAQSAQPGPQRQRRSPRSSHPRADEQNVEFEQRIRRNGSFPDLARASRGEELQGQAGPRHSRDRHRHVQLPVDPSATFPYYTSHSSRHIQTSSTPQHVHHVHHHHHVPKPGGEEPQLEPPKEFSAQRQSELQRELQRELERELEQRKRSKSASSMMRDSRSKESLAPPLVTQEKASPSVHSKLSFQVAGQPSSAKTRAKTKISLQPESFQSMPSADTLPPPFEFDGSALVGLPQHICGLEKQAVEQQQHRRPRDRSRDTLRSEATSVDRSRDKLAETKVLQEERDLRAREEREKMRVQQKEQEKRARRDRHERERLEHEKREREKLIKEKMEKDRLDQERREHERRHREKLEFERREQERQIQIELEKRERERERLEHERQVREHLERERARAEQEKREKLEFEKKEREKRERLEREKQDRLRREKRERERLEEERREKERIELERREKERLEHERRERERIDNERRERERIEHERREKERLELERRERERIEHERRERERIAHEKKLEQERLERERRKKERLEQERLEKEKQERIEHEKRERARKELERLLEEEQRRERERQLELERKEQERQRDIEKRKKEQEQIRRDREEREKRERRKREERERRQQKEEEQREHDEFQKQQHELEERDKRIAKRALEKHKEALERARQEQLLKEQEEKDRLLKEMAEKERVAKMMADKERKALEKAERLRREGTGKTRNGGSYLEGDVVDDIVSLSPEKLISASWDRRPRKSSDRRLSEDRRVSRRPASIGQSGTVQSRHSLDRRARSDDQRYRSSKDDVTHRSPSISPPCTCDLDSEGESHNQETVREVQVIVSEMAETPSLFSPPSRHSTRDGKGSWDRRSGGGESRSTMRTASRVHGRTSAASSGAYVIETETRAGSAYDEDRRFIVTSPPRSRSRPATREHRRGSSGGTVGRKSTGRPRSHSGGGPDRHILHYPHHFEGLCEVHDMSTDGKRSSAYDQKRYGSYADFKVRRLLEVKCLFVKFNLNFLALGKTYEFK